MRDSVRHFKKYANRKFYDVDRGEYVGVGDIAKVVKGGADVEMKCDRTGRDLTREILARILYEEVRRVGMPLARQGVTPGSGRGSHAPGPSASEISFLIRRF